MSVTIEQARKAKDLARQLISEHVKISAIGITKIGDDFAISVGLANAPEDDFTVPSTIEGVAVKCEIIGDVFTFAGQ